MKKTILSIMSVMALIVLAGTALAMIGAAPPYRQKNKANPAESLEALYEKYPTLKDIAIENLPTCGFTSQTESSLRFPSLKAPVSKVAAPKNFFGNIVYQNNWDSRYSAYGFYNISVTDEVSSNLLLKGTSSTALSTAGCIKLGDKVYTANWGSSFGGVEVDVRVYNLETGTRESYVELSGVQYIATDFANDEKNGVVYGVFHNSDGSGYELATVTFSANSKYTPNKTIIGSVDRNIVALGVTSDQRLYGIGDNGILYKFDRETAEASVIGDTGVKVASANGVYAQSGTIDQHNNIFYWACVNANKESVFYTVDLEDAHVEVVAQSPLQDRIYGLSALPHAANDKAPNSLIDYNVNFAGNSLQGDVTFSIPDDTFDGNLLEGDVDWRVLANGVEMTKGTAKAGQTVTASITVEAGKNIIEAYASNQAGNSPLSTTEIWAGNDTPSVKSASFEYINSIATVNWTADEVGVHGGYVGDLTYDVYRMPSNEKVAVGISGTSFSETLSSTLPLANYYYEIAPIHASMEGERVATNKIQIGQAIIPPYLETFDTPESLDLFILGDAWGWDTRGSSGDGCVQWDSDVYNPNSTAMVDPEWILTPEINLEANSTYEISFVTYGPYGDKFEVLYGEGTDPSKYKILLGETSAKGSSAMTDPHIIQLESATDQNVRIGIRHVGYEEMFIRLDNFSISAPRHAAVPGPIEDFQVTAAPLGEMKATLSFTTPSYAVDGTDLDEISDIVIYESNQVVDSIHNPGIGTHVEYVYNAERNGKHTFMAEVVNRHGVSSSVSTKTFIGVDLPYPPTATIYDRDDHLTVEWEPAETGLNGEYVNPDEITYNISQLTSSGSLSYIARDIKGTSFDIQYDPRHGQQASLQLLISGSNAAGEGPSKYTNTMIVGEPAELPFQEHFDGESGLSWVKETSSQTFDISTSHYSDGDGYSMCYGILTRKDGDAWMSSGKISLDAANPVLTLDYNVDGGNAIEIYQMRPDGSEELLAIGDEESMDMNEWKSISCELKHAGIDTYCRLHIKFANNAGPMSFMFIDNISIIDQRDNDIFVEASLSCSEVSVGTPLKVNVKANNIGANDCEGCDLQLYINDVLYETRHISSLKANQAISQTMEYTTIPSDVGEVCVLVYVDYEIDEDTENNEVLLTANVLEPLVSAPENLTGTLLDNNTVRLDWSAPTEFMTYEITEDFESYAPCATTNIGEWKLVDADGRETIGISEASFPNNGAPMAFMVFNPSYIGVPEGNTEANPHSGEQYLVSFATILDNPDDHNDDWLISPALSGKAQTITFHTKQMITNFGPEDVEVLYSTTGRETSDFILLDEIKVSGVAAWEKIEAQLPEGSMYFAIRVVTAKGHMLLIDDVTYEKGSSKTIIGYNIYRNRTKIGSTNGNQTFFIDMAPESQNTYEVSAVYVTGEESTFSNAVNVGQTGMTEINPDMEYNVMGVDGIVFIRKGRELKNLPAGIYIVNNHKMVMK